MGGGHHSWHPQRGGSDGGESPQARWATRGSGNGRTTPTRRESTQSPLCHVSPAGPGAAQLTGLVPVGPVPQSTGTRVPDWGCCGCTTPATAVSCAHTCQPADTCTHSQTMKEKLDSGMHTRMHMHSRIHRHMHVCVNKRMCTIHHNNMHTVTSRTPSQHTRMKEWS